MPEQEALRHAAEDCGTSTSTPLVIKMLNIFTFSLLVLLVGNRDGKIIMRETAYIYQFVTCPGVVTTGDVTVRCSYRGTGDYRLSADWTLKDSYSDLTANLNIKKCPTRALIDCEDYIKFPVPDLCTDTHSKLNYTRLLNSVRPPMSSCPLQGRYTLKNYSIIGEIPQVKKLLGFAFIPDNKIWSGDFSLTSRNETLLCVRIVGSFRLRRETSNP